MSPSLQQQQAVEQQLTPAQRQRFDILLSVYTDIRADYEPVKAQLDVQQAVIAQFLADCGVKGQDCEEYIMYWTRGSTTSKLMVEKLIAQGVTKAQIAAATVTKPKKDSFTIRGKKHAEAASEE